MESKISILCFGEVLWDIFPDYIKPGGAPINVAYHLKRLGIDSNIISRVGLDECGRAILKIIKDWGIPTQFCQTDPKHPTGKVLATMDADYEMSYDIVYPVAWDFIQFNPEIEQVLMGADAFVFGSLSARNMVSRKTLLHALSIAKYRVLDINLRSPYYTKDFVFILLKQTDLLKLNENELNIISNWICPNKDREEDQVNLIRNKFDLHEILLTKGVNGATFYKNDTSFHQKSYKVQVKDTVGSGDSFLAAFLSERFKNQGTSEEQLDHAAALGAYVASQKGACPHYIPSDLADFKEKYT